MALGADYITSAQLKSYMGIEIDAYDELLDNVANSTSREIEDHCHRQFNKAGSVSARVYSPLRPDLAIVDDISTTAGLVIKSDDDGDGVFETTWTADEYELRPLNGVRNGLAGWPYWQIHAVGSRSFPSARRANVQVTADWGWAAIPELVRQACFILASDTFQLKDSRLGVAGSDQFGQIVRVRDNQMAQQKLRHYVRQKVFTA